MQISLGPSTKLLISRPNPSGTKVSSLSCLALFDDTGHGAPSSSSSIL